jgi:hypothetical protein
MDPRYKVLLIALSPFICWLGGIAGIIIFWGNPVLTPVSALLFIAGFPLSLAHLKFIHKTYGRYFRRELDGLKDKDWLAIDFEILGTENKLHIVPDDCGVVFKKDNKVFLETVRGRSFVISPPECLLLFTSKTSLACTISILNGNTGEPLLDYSVTPPLQRGHPGNSLTFREKSEMVRGLAGL